MHLIFNYLSLFNIIISLYLHLITSIIILISHFSMIITRLLYVSLLLYQYHLN
jgi:hypothetical protein